MLHCLTVVSITIACKRSVSGAENGAERATNRLERSGAWQKTMEWERSAEREVAERGAGVAEIGWSAERLFRRSRSAQCSGQ